MTDPLLFNAPERPLLAVRNRPEKFPVRRIYCAGRNYLEHIREMGGNEREEPFFFQKPTDALVADGSSVAYPPLTQDFQYEVELVLAIGTGGANITVASAAEHVVGFAVGIDLTRRDVQVAARKSGRPWEIGKSFDRSAPCAPLVLCADTPLPLEGMIELEVNGVRRQAGDLSQMIWNPLEIVSKLSEHYALAAGDLVYTGTPAGVGPVVRGDRIDARIGALSQLSLTIA